MDINSARSNITAARALLLGLPDAFAAAELQIGQAVQRIEAALADLDKGEGSNRLVLHWPVAEHRITQRFGEHPEWASYASFEPRGHEGVDLACPHGGIVMAACDGMISAVGWRKPGHAYGYAVRQRVSFPGVLYEIIYAHGMEHSTAVVINQAVKTGQLLMSGDSTGNSKADHLHLSVKMPLLGGKPQTPPAGVRFSRLANGEIMLDPLAFWAEPLPLPA